ncbi:hypothetical protein OBV_03130 [Oscillibacter valericigenes Sjm18-20]|nr:hypothetical protein OBV_03130 [Oscillibacter valericigenes Sjm18-20]
MVLRSKSQSHSDAEKSILIKNYHKILRGAIKSAPFERDSLYIGRSKRAVMVSYPAGKLPNMQINLFKAA